MMERPGMKIARVIGNVTLNHREPNLRTGRLLVAEALDAAALAGVERSAPRATAMPQSLVVYDDLGAGVGQIIAVSEGAEASMPFRPEPKTSSVSSRTPPTLCSQRRSALIAEYSWKRWSRMPSSGIMKNSWPREASVVLITSTFRTLKPAPRSRNSGPCCQTV